MSLGVEVYRRDIAELTDAVVDGSSEYLPYRLFVLKFYLGLGGMYVHVDVTCRHGEIDEVRHLHAHCNHSLKGIHHRLVEIGVLHISAIDEEILLRSLLLCRFRFAYESRNAAYGCLHLDGQQVVVESLSKHIHDALSQCACMQVHQLQSIAKHRKRDLGIYQCDALKGGHDVIELCGIAL